MRFYFITAIDLQFEALTQIVCDKCKKILKLQLMTFYTNFPNSFELDTLSFGSKR